MHEFEQFGSSYEHANQHAQMATRQSRSQNKSAIAAQIIDPFFDESAEELSSIEQSQAGVDAYGEQQLGYNPYEQAKRQALKNAGHHDHKQR